ncbi:MAG TPA: LytTR family DNA-binding domain-containing protein [Puia sp.]|nr:LytTR family DNA-binding domain-containing protein [Puia sp.]
MIRTIIVDDEPRGLNTLNKLLQEYCPELKIVAACADAESAKEKVLQMDPQLAFLDISLPEKTSFDLLSELGEVNFEIIFVTAHNQYAIQAFQFSAIDYLMKPIDEDLLINAVKRAERRIAANTVNHDVSTFLHNVQKTQVPQEMKLCIPSLKGFQVVEIKDILFCEASGSYTNFYFDNKNFVCTAKAIHEYESLLQDAGFVRIHKSYLVNLRHIKEYLRGEGGSVILSNGKELEVSRRKKEFFLDSMKEFYKF